MSTMPILLSKNIDKVYQDDMREWPQDGWQQMFHVQRMNSRTEDHLLMEGYPLPQPRIDGGRIVMAQFKADFDKRFTARSWGLGDSFPKEMVKDDPWGIMRKGTAVTATMFARTYRTLNHKEAAYMLVTLCFASGTVVGSPDGVSLANTAHPISKSNSATTWANRPSIDADMSFTSLNAGIAALRTQLDATGNTRLINPPRLLACHPSKRGLARQFLQGEMERGTSDNNMNALREYNIKIVDWPYYEVSGATGTNNGWGLWGQEHELHWKIRQNLDVDTDFDVMTKSYIITTDVRFDYGWLTARGTYFSKGS